MTTDEHQVGYGRPPVATQFKKGQSGNPRGRPKKANSRRAITERVLSETKRLAGQPQGTRVIYSTLEVLVMKLKQVAGTGHAQATGLFTRIVERFGRQEPVNRNVGFVVVPERLTIEEWEAKYSPKDSPPEDPEPSDGAERPFLDVPGPPIDLAPADAEAFGLPRTAQDDRRL